MFGIPIRHLARYQEVLTILLRHGLGYFLFPAYRPIDNFERIGAHLREALIELGPTFIKLGQLASTRSDIFPQPIINELAKLQNRVAPLPFEWVRQVIEKSLQASLGSLFSEFNPVPIAAASLGQVHEALLKSGERVVVKVQRPRIKERVETDLEIFQIFITQIEQRTEWGRRYPLHLLFEEFSRTLWDELDFLIEGKNTEQFAKLRKRNKKLRVPKVYWQFSCSSVLTQEYIEGIPLSQILEHVKLGQRILPYNIHLIAVQISQEFLHQILREGYFHGDPHPGNILITPEEKIALIDFGSIGNLSSERRAQLISLFTAFARGEEEKLFSVIQNMGVIPKQIDKSSFQKELSVLRAKHAQVFSHRMSMGEAIQDFFDLINRFGIIIPSEFVLLGKSILTLEGTLATLDPAVSLIEQAIPYSPKLLLSKYNLIELINTFRVKLKIKARKK
jgi:ubiquinone biosynthesis protein